MAYFALIWKARTIEKYRLQYEKEKLKAMQDANIELPKQSLSQKWEWYQYNMKKRLTKKIQNRCSEGSKLYNFIHNLKTDQTLPNFVVKSIIGFVGGIILTYLWFMFFVFQLSISLINATIMSSIIGVLLTLGLAFSYRIRCLVFLLIPQFFSRVGRYTLTCYALVLILTGPATNTLKNSEVLSESLACGQEQIKSGMRQVSEFSEKPFHAMKDIIKLMMEKIQQVVDKLKITVVKFRRLVLSIVDSIQSSSVWLEYVAKLCNKKMGNPYERCIKALNEGLADCQASLPPSFAWLCNIAYVSKSCSSVKAMDLMCQFHEYVGANVAAVVRKKLQTFSNEIQRMVYVEVHIEHSLSLSTNLSKTTSQIAVGVVTEIRNRADPLLTWLSWSSCVTSLFLFLIIFRAKHYQHMFETRSRFDNRYITKELWDLDIKRLRQRRETVLPLNRRERAKYITTTSFSLLSSEKVYLARSAIFMIITTLKLLIHIVADYSLYWMLITIRYYGKMQTPGGPSNAGLHLQGIGFVANLIRSLLEPLTSSFMSQSPSISQCLPDPYPPDFHRYKQIGVLIVLLWFFALFEPYGLRLRHVIMGLYRPERAKARATWLYNHILRNRTSFMKFARRKLHREYKYYSETKYTFRRLVKNNIRCTWILYIFGMSKEKPKCLLCGITEVEHNVSSHLIRCEVSECPGIFCSACFSDIGQLCTICLLPIDYGDLSDVSLEKGSSAEDSENEDPDDDDDDQHKKGQRTSQNKTQENFNAKHEETPKQSKNKIDSPYTKTYATNILGKSQNKLFEDMETKKNSKAITQSKIVENKVNRSLKRLSNSQRECKIDIEFPHGIESSVNSVVQENVLNSNITSLIPRQNETKHNVIKKAIGISIKYLKELLRATNNNNDTYHRKYKKNKVECSKCNDELHKNINGYTKNEYSDLVSDKGKLKLLNFIFGNVYDINLAKLKVTKIIQETRMKEYFSYFLHRRKVKKDQSN